MTNIERAEKAKKRRDMLWADVKGKILHPSSSLLSEREKEMFKFADEQNDEMEQALRDRIRDLEQAVKKAGRDQGPKKGG